jgi:DsbE subfamily thiol:disulfide oxidoreductase
VSRPAARVLLLSLASALGACSSPIEVPSVAVQEVDDAAPALAGETVAGGPLEPDAFAGRPVVVNFWATWCGPCRREQPLLVAAAAREGDGGAAFVGVNYRDDADAAARWLREYAVGYPSLSDPLGELGDDFGVPGLPTTVVIDAEGQIRFRVLGELDRETLDELLAEISVA